MATVRSRQHIRDLSGSAELELPSGRRLAVDYLIEIDQDLIDGAPGALEYTVGLTPIAPLNEVPVVEMVELYQSNDTALLDVARENPPWQRRVLLFEPPPVPWSSPTSLCFRLNGDLPRHLLDPQ